MPNISRYFCCHKRSSLEEPLAPNSNTLDAPEERPVPTGAAAIYSCIVSSAFHLVQALVERFVPGRRGEAIANSLDAAEFVAEEGTHAAVDRVLDRDFYAWRAREHGIEDRSIEEPARAIGELSNRAIARVDFFVQLMAREPVVAHGFVTALQFCGAFVFGNTVAGSIWLHGTATSLHAIIRAYDRANIPSEVVSLTAHGFFDWVSDRVVRDGIIYNVVDNIIYPVRDIADESINLITRSIFPVYTANDSDAESISTNDTEPPYQAEDAGEDTSAYYTLFQADNCA